MYTCFVKIKKSKKYKLFMNEIPTINLLLQQETPEEQLQAFIPKTFDDYLGQQELKKKLAIYTQAAKMRGEPLDHLLPVQNHGFCAQFF